MKKGKGNYDASLTFLYERCIKDWWPALDAGRQVFHYKKGEIIFKEGDPVTGVYFMLDGVVKVHKHWADDKELIVRFARQQDIIGHRGLSTNSNVYPISATVLADCTICFIDMALFRSTFAVNDRFAYDFMMFMADELLLSEQRMRDLAHMQVKARTAKALLALEKKFGVNEGGYIAFTISRQDLASYIGTVYETVYKLLAEFSEAGAIKTDGKDIAITHPAKLEAIATG